MTIRVDTGAQREFIEAIAYYAADSAVVSEEFRVAMELMIAEILEAPKRWPTAGYGCRRHRSARFPYSIVYRIFDEEIVIFAIPHAARKPRYWRHRI